MPRSVEKDTTYRRHYSWGEWVQAARDNLGTALRESRSIGPADSWGGGIDTLWTGEEAIDAAEGAGYTAPIEEVANMLRHIETDIGDGMHNQFVSTYDVAGGAVDVGRFLSGDPECMQVSMPMKVMRTGRVIKVAVPVGYQADISAETIKARGVAVMALVDAFAQMQHPVEVIAVRAGYGSRQRFCWTITVQPSDEPLNMGRMLFALAHPAMTRKMAFTIAHGEDHNYKRTFSVPGSYAMSPRTAYIEDLDINVENSIILPELTSNYGWSEKESVAWIKAQLEMIKEGAV